jgi:recombination protein RecT
MNAVAEKVTHPLVVFKQQLDAREGEFKAALPAHIPAERFARVVMTACQRTPDLLNVERRSLFLAALQCAQDGLLPDGREAALVTYKDRDRGLIAQYLPMIAGLRKKCRNSGEIATWDVHAVFSNDAFEFELGDDPFIRHKPCLEDRGKLIAVYSIATLKSGEKSRDVMSVGEVEKIRAKSRAKNGPWADPTFYPEMAKKTVARRHSKVLPMATDLDDLIRRDDALYDLEGARAEASALSGGRPQSLTGKLDALAGPSHAVERQAPQHDAETGEIPPREIEGDATSEDEPENDAAEPQAPKGPFYDAGQKDARDGMSRKALPTELRTQGREADAAAWLAGFDDHAAKAEG